MKLHPPTHGTYVGHDVVDSENHEVGTVSDVIYDDDGNRPAWLVVDLGLLHGARYVPVAHSYTADNGNIVVPYDKHQVKGAIKPPRNHVLTAEDVERLITHHELHDTRNVARPRAHDGRHGIRDVLQVGAHDERHDTGEFGGA